MILLRCCGLTRTGWVAGQPLTGVYWMITCIGKWALISRKTICFLRAHQLNHPIHTGPSLTAYTLQQTPLRQAPSTLPELTLPSDTFCIPDIIGSSLQLPTLVSLHTRTSMDMGTLRQVKIVKLMK